ncbi:MAG: C25 family cysteine peptidase, partial [Bacteroidota bacterium]
MMKRIFQLFILLMGVQVGIFAQTETPYDWIEFDNVVFAKVRANTKGITRIPQEMLAEVPIFPTGSRVDPKRFRVFYRGEEIAIRVFGEEDGSFDPGDYIEIFAQPNDGELELELYDDPDHKTNPNRMLFTRHSYYFVSFQREADKFGKRIEVVPYEENDTLVEMPFHLQEDIVNPNGGFLYGQLSPTSLSTVRPAGGAVDSRYVEGKGKVGRLISYFPFERTIVNVDFDVQNYFPDTLLYPVVNWRLYGAYNWLNTIESFLGPKDNLTRMPDLVFRNYSSSFSRHEITPESGIRFPQQDGNFRIRFTASTTPGTASFYHFALGRLVYPQSFDTPIPEEGKQFNLLANDSLPAVNITFGMPPSSPKVYDLTDYANVRELEFSPNTADGLRVSVPNNGVSRKLWVFSDTINYTVTDAVGVRWLNISELDPSRYDYLIITHESLLNSATRYKNYRESAEGGGHRVLLVTIDALYNTFTFGETTPLAIRRFVEYMYANGNPEFLFLLGGGLRFDLFGEIDRRDRTGQPYQNFIPPYGVPSSDNLYTAGLDPTQNSLVPSIPVGRLGAMTNEQVNNYLNKVIEYETDPTSQTWRKNILQLSGGISAQENAIFRRYAEGFGRKAEGDFLGADVKTISKRTTDFVEFINIADEINQGTLLLTFFGHASVSFTDIEIGRIGDPNIGYANKGRYPLILVNGCGTGDPFQGNPGALAENWMLAKDAGAIAFLAHSGIGFSGTLRNYTDIFYETAFTDRQFINKTLGEVYNETVRRCLQRSPNNPLMIANVQQVLLQGDPAIRLVPFEQPDYQAT